MVEELEGQPETGPAENPRREAARRCSRERSERMKQAAEELEKIRAGKKREERQEARVSLTEPEARIMSTAMTAAWRPATTCRSVSMANKDHRGDRVDAVQQRQWIFAAGDGAVRKRWAYPEQVVADGDSPIKLRSRR